jgi:hypothetical protein
MSGLSVSPLASGDGGIVPGMLVHQAPGGPAATVARAQADTLTDAQGQLYVVEFSSTAPGGKVLADVIGRKPLLLEAGLTPQNGDTLYLSASTAGCATNVPPAGIVRSIGTILDTSTYGTNNLVDAVLAPGSTMVPYLTITYYVTLAASTLFAGTWVPVGTTTTLTNDHVETPVPTIIKGIQLTANVRANTISSGAITLAIVQNGGPPAAGGKIAFAAGSTGVKDSLLALGQTSTVDDTWGLTATSSAQLATGSLTAIITMYLYA